MRWDLKGLQYMLLSYPRRKGFIKPVAIFSLQLVLTGACIIFQFDPVWGEEKYTDTCLKKVGALAQKRDKVNDLGGIWTLLEKSPDLRNASVEGLQLDSKINAILTTLNYLCTTADGVPLNDLAIYLKENLNHQEKQTFKEELIILGKNETDIEIWFKFHDLSLINEIRTLDYEAINSSIQKAGDFFSQYEKLAGAIPHGQQETIIDQTRSLIEGIDRFLSQDPVMAQGVSEESQAPYWDINEDVGGS